MNEIITQTEGYLEKALTQFSVTDAAIAQMESKFMTLEIKGLDDVEGYKVVKSARMKVKGCRVDTEKTRKGLKEEALVFGRGVDGKAKQIAGRLLPIETYLHDMEKGIDDEKLRIKNEAANKERDRIQGRIKKLYDMGMMFDGFGYACPERNVKGEEYLHVSSEQLTAMSDEEYDKLVSDVEAIKQKNEAIQREADREKKEEEARLEEIRTKQAAESKRLAADRIKLRAEQAAKEAELQTERKKLDVDKRAAEKTKQDAIDKKTREEELEKAAKEAADKAVKDKEEKEKKDAEEKAKAEKAVRLEAELKEKLKPDNEKLLTLADTMHAIIMPTLATVQAHKTLVDAQGHLHRAIQILRQGA